MLRHTRYSRLVFSLAATLLLLSGLPAPLVADEHAHAARLAAQEPIRGQKTPQVFIVHSYTKDYPWTDAIEQGLRDGLRGAKTRIETVYLDAKRDQSVENMRAKAKALLERIETSDPEIVIAVDDPAQIYLSAPYLRGRVRPQVIFCGVNAPLKNYGFPAANVSGVRERWHFRQSVELMQQISPRVKRVGLVTDDSETSIFLLAGIREEMAKAGPMSATIVGLNKVGTFQQWQRAVKSLQNRADALAVGLFHSLRDERTGQVVPPETIHAWTEAANRLPTIGFGEYARKHELLCGILSSGREQGALAAAMARSLLEHNNKAGELPVRINQKGVIYLNLKTAKRFGILVPFSLIEAAEVVAQ